LLNKDIGLENKRKELGEQKRKFKSHGQSSSNTRPHYSSHKILSSALVNKVEDILKTYSCSARSSSPAL
jgi:hypothetical protein